MAQDGIPPNQQAVTNSQSPSIGHVHALPTPLPRAFHHITVGGRRLGFVMPYPSLRPRDNLSTNSALSTFPLLSGSCSVSTFLPAGALLNALRGPNAGHVQPTIVEIPCLFRSRNESDCRLCVLPVLSHIFARPRRYTIATTPRRRDRDRSRKASFAACSRQPA